MNSPAYVVSKMVQRFTYNVGRIQKELGLGKLSTSSLIATVSV